MSRKFAIRNKADNSKFIDVHTYKRGRNYFVTDYGGSNIHTDEYFSETYNEHTLINDMAEDLNSEYDQYFERTFSDTKGGQTKEFNPDEWEVVQIEVNIKLTPTNKSLVLQLIEAVEDSKKPILCCFQYPDGNVLRAITEVSRDTEDNQLMAICVSNNAYHLDNFKSFVTDEEVSFKKQD